MLWKVLFPSTLSSSSSSSTGDHIGLTLFLLSSAILFSKQTSAYANIFRINTHSRWMINPESESSHVSSSSKKDDSTVTSAYVAILRTLFQPVKSPSRHLGTTEIFQYRQQFFYQLYREMQLDQHCKFIHVAGTKGKGSTCEYLAASLTAAGYHVGVFTSPHLHTARERIKIGHELISMEDIIAHGQQAIQRLETHSWAAVFFDYFLTMALLYFGKQSSLKKLDYVILECGIGGRYDSTNFFPSNIDPTRHSCVITSISYDHQAILGNTLPEIAWQKAGIMRKGCKVFVTDQQPSEVLEAFQQEANKVQADLIIVPIDKSKLTSKGIPYEHHAQLQNCMLADAVLSQWHVSAKEGVSQFYWPCRMETFHLHPKETQVSVVSSSNMSIASSPTPLSPTATAVSSLESSNLSSTISSPTTPSLSLQQPQLVVLDGCHNGESIRVFLQSLHEKYPAHQKLIIFGAGMEKSIDMMLQELFVLADKIVFVQSQHFKSYSEMQLINKLSTIPQEFHHKMVYLPTLGSTLGGTVGLRLVNCIRSFSPIHNLTGTNCNNSSSVSENDSRPTVIGVCGSLFVAADAREALYRLDSELFGESDWVRFADPPIF